MKYTAALRVTGEICFYFSILSLFAAFRPWLIPMAAFAAACLAVALIAVRLRSAPVRALLALLPGVCFLFTPWSLLLIFPGLAWLYFALCVGLGRFDVYLDDYRRAFRVMLIACAFVVAIHGINVALFRGEGVTLDSVIYLACYLLLVSVALRGMQMGAGWTAAGTRSTPSRSPPRWRWRCSSRWGCTGRTGTASRCWSSSSRRCGGCWNGCSD